MQMHRRLVVSSVSRHKDLLISFRTAFLARSSAQSQDGGSAPDQQLVERSRREGGHGDGDDSAL